MASTGGGKMRPKRAHGANKPYQRTRPKSFLDRVKDLVTPSWLSNMWAGSSPEESPNQQQQQCVNQPTSSMNSIPQRQTVFSPDDRYFNPIEIDLVQEPEPRPFGTGVRRVTEQGDEGVVTTPVLTPFAGLSVPVSTSTPVDVDDDDDDDDVIEVDAGEGPSTQKDDVSSVVSSLYPNLDKFEHQQKLSDSNLDVLTDLGHRSTPRPSTSLWSHTPSGRQATTRARPASPFSRPQQPAISTRKPSFNTSYFGTPRGSVKTSMDSSTSSPFYAGRTTFGGSSSMRSTTSKRPRTSPYEIHLPIKRSVRPRLAKPADESDMGITSNTAKRILDTLEKMSTPLSDAKRIPLSPSSIPLAFTSSRTPRPRPSSSPQRSVGLSHSSVKIPGPPVSGYNTPRTVSITPNRQPPLAASAELPKKATPSTSKPSREETVISNPQSSVPVPTPAFTGFFSKPITGSSTAQPSSLTRVDKTPDQTSPLQKATSGGKMKITKRGSGHYTARKDDDDDVTYVPDLPNIPLPLGNGKSLPSFNFGKPFLPAKETSSSSTSDAAPASVPSQGFNIVTSTPAVSVPAAEENKEEEFTFASPILRQPSSTISAPEIETTEAFTFSIPKKAEAFPAPPSKPMNTMKPSSISHPPQTPSFMDQSPVKSPPRDTQGDEEERGGFGIMPAKTLKTGSCLEFLGLVPSSDTTSIESTTETPTKSSKDTIEALAEKFKPPPGSWECDTCLIQNKADHITCISCQTAKRQMVNSHGIPSGGGKVDVIATNDLQARFRPPEGSWECPECMIPNSKDVNRCVACETLNPDSSTKAPPVSTKSLMDKLKPPEGSWECDTCLVENKADAFKCVACTSAKPGVAVSNNPTASSNTALTNSNGGSWQCASCPEKNNAGVLKCKGCGVLMPTSNSSISTENLMDKLRPPPGSWNCDVCLVCNKESTDRCLACTAPKPGSQPSLNTPPASVFKFGSQSYSSPSSTTGDYQFGGATSSANFGAGPTKGFNIPTGGVTFGSQNATTGLTFGSQKDSPASGFQFGSNSEGKTNSLPSADTVQFGSVKASKTFGAPIPSGSLSTKEDKPAVSASFQFGDGTTTTTTTTTKAADTVPQNVDPFKSAEPSKTAFGAGGVMVNAAPASTQETDNAQPKAAFSFGANKAATSTLKFSAAVTEPKQTSAPISTFAFGAKAPSDNNPPKRPSTFNFSASSNPPSSESQQSTGKAVFKLDATPSSDTKDEPNPLGSSAGFSFGSTANAINKTTQPTPHQNNMPPAYSFGQSNAGSDEAGTGGPLAKGGVTFGSSVKQTSAPESKSSFSFGGTPGQTATQPASTTFVFGGADNKVETQSKPNGGLTFGTPSQSAASSQPNDQFTFRAATNSNKPGGFNFSSSVNQTAAPTTGGFQFGAAAPATKVKENAPPAYAAFGSSNPTSSSVFGGFGAQTTSNSTPNPFGGQQPSQAVAPTFGTPSSSSVFGSVAAAPAFGTVASANNSRSSTPTFGATGGSAAPGFGSSVTTVPAFGAGATNSGIGFQTEAAPAFNFGGSNAGSTAPGVFAFGAANNNTAQSTAVSQSTSGFNFGGQQQQQQQQQQQPSGFGMQGGAQNATGAAGSAPGGVFQFGANQSPAATSFSFGQGTQQRKIRKAVRRTRKT